MEDPCQKCGLREAEYDAPGIWCEVCWIDWWCEGTVTKDMDARERAAYRRDVKREIKQGRKEERRKERRERKQKRRQGQ